MMRITEVIKILENIQKEEGDILTDIEEFCFDVIPEECHIGTDEKVCEVWIVRDVDDIN